MTARLWLPIIVCMGQQVTNARTLRACRPKRVAKTSKQSITKAAAIAVIGVLLPATGCRSSGRPTIAVIPRTTALVLWEAEHAGAEISARKAGFNVYWNAPTSEDDVDRQITIIRQAVNRGAAGLILAPDQALALMVPVRDVVARGIPTVVISSPLAIPAGGKLSYILNDEEETGRLAAERIGSILHGEGSVAVLGIDPDVTGIIHRAHAFEANLAAKYPRIKIVDERTGGFNITEAQEITEDVLAANPQVGAILALNSAATRGAFIALENRRLLGKIKLVACEQELIPPLVTGEIDSLIVENTYEMGYRAVQLIAAQLRGEKVPAEIKLRPQLVTRDNLNTPEVQRMLTMNWRASN